MVFPESSNVVLIISEETKDSFKEVSENNNNISVGIFPTNSSFAIGHPPKPPKAPSNLLQPLL
jgi:hypothetical protein